MAIHSQICYNFRQARLAVYSYYTLYIIYYISLSFIYYILYYYIEKISGWGYSVWTHLGTTCNVWRRVWSRPQLWMCRSTSQKTQHFPSFQAANHSMLESKFTAWERQPRGRSKFLITRTFSLEVKILSQYTFKFVQNACHWNDQCCWHLFL